MFFREILIHLYQICSKVRIVTFYSKLLLHERHHPRNLLINGTIVKRGSLTGVGVDNRRLKTTPRDEIPWNPVERAFVRRIDRS